MTRKLTKASPGDAESSDLNRHERKCLVCNHPERDAIEDEYLHWHHPHSIAIDFDLRERNIYDHAKATGLRALRAYSCLTDDGRWAEPESRVVFSYKPAMAESRSNLALPAPMHEASDVTMDVAILPLPTVAELPAKAGAVLDLQPVEALPLPAEADLLAKAGDQFLIGSPSD